MNDVDEILSRTAKRGQRFRCSAPSSLCVRAVAVVVHSIGDVVAYRLEGDDRALVTSVVGFRYYFDEEVRS